MDGNVTKWADQARTHPEALHNLEQHAIHNATADLVTGLAAAQKTSTARWLLLLGPDATIPGAEQIKALVRTIRDILASLFRRQIPRAQRAVLDAATTAGRLGIRQATSIVTAITGASPPPIPPVTPSLQAQQAANGIPAGVETEHQAALALLTTSGLTALGLAGLTSVFTRARRAVSRISAAVAVAVTSSAAAAVTVVARALGPEVRLLWVAEHDACPACAAYAGLTVRPGQLFPGGLSLDPRRTTFPSPIASPPRHIHCRCVLIPWLPAWQTGGIPLPELLRRRARQTTRRP